MMMLWESNYQHHTQVPNPHNFIFVGPVFYLEVLTTVKPIQTVYGLQHGLDTQIQPLRQKVSNYSKVITSTQKLGQL